MIWRRCGSTREERRSELEAHDVKIKKLSGCQLPSVTWELPGDSPCRTGQALIVNYLSSIQLWRCMRDKSGKGTIGTPDDTCTANSKCGHVESEGKAQSSSTQTIQSRTHQTIVLSTIQRGTCCTVFARHDESVGTSSHWSIANHIAAQCRLATTNYLNIYMSRSIWKDLPESSVKYSIIV